MLLHRGRGHRSSPAFVETVTVYSDSDGIDKDFILCNNLPSLLWLCQLADLEWHVSLATTAPREQDSSLPVFAGSLQSLEDSSLNFPDVLLFDFDPYIYRSDETPQMEPQPNADGFAAAKEAAFALRSVLTEFGIPAFVKTSGATGLHVFVPLERTLDFDGARAIAVTLAGELVRRQPRLVTTEWSTGKRRGKVFLDANQNSRHKALAAPFSPRAHPGAPVSMPVSWEALPSLRPGDNTIRNAIPMLRRGGDPRRGLRAASVDLREILALN